MLTPGRLWRIRGLASDCRRFICSTSTSKSEMAAIEPTRRVSHSYPRSGSEALHHRTHASTLVNHSNHLFESVFCVVRGNKKANSLSAIHTWTDTQPVKLGQRALQDQSTPKHSQLGRDHSVEKEPRVADCLCGWYRGKTHQQLSRPQILCLWQDPHGFQSTQARPVPMLARHDKQTYMPNTMPLDVLISAKRIPRALSLNCGQHSWKRWRNPFSPALICRYFKYKKTPDD